VRRVLLCGGKVYYDLLAARAKRAASGGEQVAIVRFEQLAPLSPDDVTAALAPYEDAQLVWVQEEPANQGAWPFMALNLPALLGGRSLSCVSRAASASPASGSHKVHDLEQADLVDRAFAL
jgi:2-oxoglutarate dehydrogenase E1 component